MLALAAVAVLLVGLRAQRRGVEIVRLFPTVVLALVLVLILVNKVGSPQFSTWLAAPIILGLVLEARAWWLPAGIALAIAALTQIVYPFFYDSLLAADPLLVSVLTLRNLLEVVLLGWALHRLWTYAGTGASTPAGIPHQLPEKRTSP